MQFIDRSLACQYISQSFQDVLQQYPSGSELYILDGLGNVVAIIPSASLGQVLITSDVTSSMTVLSASYSVVNQIYQTTSSFSDTADFAVLAGNTLYTASYALTSSYALNAGSGGGGGTNLNTGSLYPFTSSWSQNTETASFSPVSDFAVLSGNTLYTASYAVSTSFANVVSSSYSETSSYVWGASPIKAGILSGSVFGASFNGDLTASVNFIRPFSSNLYSISITADMSPRIWLAVSRSINGFIIDSGDSNTIVGDVMWQAIYIGEYN